MKYPESYAVDPGAVKPGLDRINVLLARLGHPERCAPAVLVTGTNGKGSTAWFLAGLLRHHGLRPGLYLSPHLVSPTERIHIDGQPVKPEVLASWWDTALATVTTDPAAFVTSGDPTYFEALTAAAFAIFAAAGVDIMVLEIGLGGRWDATNVADPSLSIITSISLDHTDFLGDNRISIAWEKFGVARPHRPLLCGPVPPHIEFLLARWSRRLGAAFMPWSTITAHCEPFARLTWPAVDMALISAHPGLAVSFNLAVAAAAQILAQFGIPFDPAAISLTAAAGPPPGRGQVLSLPEGRRLILDGAHNLEALELLLTTLRHADIVPDYAFFGCMADKPAAAMCHRLAATAIPEIVLIPVFGSSRSWSLRTRRRLAKVYGFRLGPDNPVAWLADISATAGTILVCGSFYLVGTVLTHLAPPTLAPRPVLSNSRPRTII